MKKGLDLSKYQKGINFSQIKAAGYEFVILRAGYTGTGTGISKNIDPCFEDFYKKAKATGLGVGAYWYSCANSFDKGVSEAQFMLNNCLKGKSFNYPIYIDVEERKYHNIGKKPVAEAIKGFCETLESAGYYAGFYTMPDFLNNYIDKDIVKAYDLWLANWVANKPTIYREYGMWQNSDKGNVGGYMVDTNISYKDYPNIIAVAGLNGLRGNSSTPAPSKAPAPAKKSVDDIAREVIAGKWGTNPERANKLRNSGYNPNEIQARVNALMGVKKAPAKKSIDEIAREVIAGKWGVNPARAKKLRAAGYNPDEVQAKVNALMK